jgi:hypothetical protein
VDGELTREKLVLRLAEVSHRTWIRQAVRDKGMDEAALSVEVHPHDLERAEDTVQELERLGIWQVAALGPLLPERLAREASLKRWSWVISDGGSAFSAGLSELWRAG